MLLVLSNRCSAEEPKRATLDLIMAALGFASSERSLWKYGQHRENAVPIVDRRPLGELISCAIEQGMPTYGEVCKGFSI